MNNVLKITGLDCANCARELEEELSKIKGVESATVDFMTQKVYVDCDEKTLEEVKKACNSFEEVKVAEDAPDKIKVTGLCCANCARELEEDLNKIEGVTARVDFMNSNITLSAQTEEARGKAVHVITHFEDVKIVEEARRKKGVFVTHWISVSLICTALIFFINALSLEHGFGLDRLDIRISVYSMYSLAYLLAGYKVLLLTVKNILKGKIFDENFLMTVASIGAILLGIFTGEGFFEGVAVMILYQIGELLQSIAVGASRSSISALMDLKSETATKLDNGVQRVVKPEELRVGDIILIKAGEKVPVDCVVCEGKTALDMKSLNGEPLPREVSEGDEILSGSINLSGVIQARVTREYKNSAVAKILELVENSTAKKSKPEKFISKFAKYYTPAVCLAAAVVAGIVPTIICAVNASFVWATYSSWIYKALGFLVISCPCALVISVPLSYFGGIGRCAKSGILVKGSTCLDELALASIAAFDKTGTITEGKFYIKSYPNDETLKLAAAAEKYSSHPIAAAFDEIETDVEVTDAEEVTGKGVKCVSGGKVLLCGNSRLLRENSVEFAEKDSSSTVVYVAHGGAFLGAIEIDDRVKGGVKDAVKALKSSGITRTVMLTGDLMRRAEAICGETELDGFKAELLPADKLNEAEKLKTEGKLLYVGDGINDAPVMTVADCAVSMGTVGSDAAIEASDIVLVSDNIALLPKGRRIAKGTRAIVKQNIIVSLLVKAVIMALDIAIPGFPLIVSVVADVGVMLAAVLNAMRTALIK